VGDGSSRRPSGSKMQQCHLDHSAVPYKTMAFELYLAVVRMGATERLMVMDDVFFVILLKVFQTPDAFPFGEILMAKIGGSFSGSTSDERRARRRECRRQSSVFDRRHLESHC
jgi:hypothetical protein